ncbi:MAG: poly-gamma-glutamate synthase PgsB [Candidatus Aminicenantes bacterium]|jgi:poly-gamma-glutamate synthase PgsB/CapB|nr:poly-gamma-glutamate synthase PgsB [Candidatus Aminicenantes bacterium]
MDRGLFFTFLVIVLYFSLEAFAHRQNLRKVPRRIAVFGIRGKSSITRLIASGLREAGFKVLAKTTGSRPVIIYPDGREKEIRRRGRPTILEQKNLVKEAAKEGVDFLVAEMMSIQPECLRVESQQLLKPQMMVLSNIRPDHIDFLGRNRKEIAISLASAFLQRSCVFIPEEEASTEIEKLAQRAGSDLVKIGQNSFSEELLSFLPYPEFEPNLRLAIAVLKELGLCEEKIKSGLTRVKPDYGCLRIWKKYFNGGRGFFYFVSLFAANDPQSTEEAMEMIIKKMGWERRLMAGLVALREDRGDRTQQWLDYFLEKRSEENGNIIKNYLDLITFVGPGKEFIFRKLRKSQLWSRKLVWLREGKNPEKCFNQIISFLLEEKHSDLLSDSAFSTDSSSFSPSFPHPALAEDEHLIKYPFSPVVIFGLGNIVGYGQQIIDYLEKTADAIKL